MKTVQFYGMTQMTCHKQVRIAAEFADVDKNKKLQGLPTPAPLKGHNARNFSAHQQQQNDLDSMTKLTPRIQVSPV